MNAILNSVRRFGSDARGNVAMMFGLASLGLVGAVGLAMDYTHAQTMRTKVAVAADGAVLAGAKLTGKPESQRQEIALQHFNAAIAIQGGVHIVAFTGHDIKAGNDVEGFRVEVDAYVPTTFGKLFGLSKLPFKIETHARGGSMSNVEIALVLDKTGSMAGAKMLALKAAATDLVTTLTAKATTPDQIKFALVPFATHVNVGMANRNAPWISVPPDQTVNACWFTYPNAISSNCRLEPYTYLQDGVPVTTTTQVCDWDWGAPVEVCGPTTSQWYGCVGSRNYPLNVQDGTYSTPVPGLLDAWCPGEIVALTSNAATINTAIGTLTAEGGTYIPAGLAWGWRVLSPDVPYNESQKGKNPKKINRYMILMTDGANSQSPNYPDNWGTDVGVANTLTQELCENIKNDDIQVFTIAFEVTDATIKNILQGCASGPGNFFNATDAAQLASAFKAIGSSLTALRLSK